MHRFGFEFRIGAAGDGIVADALFCGLSNDLFYTSSSTLEIRDAQDTIIDTTAQLSATSGSSRSLDGAILDAVGNDNSGDWCNQTTFTPGTANPSCP